MKLSNPHIVIIGGGAGGLELATRLGRSLGKKQHAKITLIDSSPTHLWKPLLHEVAAGTLDSNEDELNYLTHAYNHYYQFQLGSFAGLNRAQRSIILAPILDKSNQVIIPERSLNYDILVIAIGSICNDFDVPGVKENCFFIDTRQQADQFQQQFLASLLQAQYQNKPLAPGQLEIAIVGGGATGVELAAELQYSIRQAVNYGLDKINLKTDVKITVIEASDRILPMLPEDFSKSVADVLHKLDIQIIKERVIEVTPEGLKTAGGKFIPAALKIWTAGIKAPNFLAHLDGLETNKLNQLIVKPTLQTTVDEHIFALGDCAFCLQSGKNQAVPPRAQAAHQQAKLLAKSLTAWLKGRPLLPYTYRDYGSLISLSRNDTLGSLMGKVTRFTIEGKIARLVYISLYKGHQVVLHGLWRVILSGFANLLTRRTKPRLKLH